MKLLPLREPDEDRCSLNTVGYFFYCPGCQGSHLVHIQPYKNSVGASWSFTGNLQKPTFSPSINIRVVRTEGKDVLRCHSFVENGMIRYLDDCTHALAGQTVELPDLISPLLEREGILS